MKSKTINISINIEEEALLDCFDPDMLSFVFAVNSKSLESDLEVVKLFSNGQVVKLLGVWEGKEERSYQILSKDVRNLGLMASVLLAHNQEAMLYIGNGRITYQLDLRGGFLLDLGKMIEYEGYDNHTHCLASNKKWRAVNVS